MASLAVDVGKQVDGSDVGRDILMRCCLDENCSFLVVMKDGDLEGCGQPKSTLLTYLIVKDGLGNKCNA